MKVLMAFDGEININEFIDLINDKSVYEISLLDFSSDFSFMKDLHSTLRSKGVKSIKVISMTELFNEEINIIREKINKWSSDIGDCMVAGKSVKEWFLLKDFNISTWWLGLLSEKNPGKTCAFAQVGQLKAFKKLIETARYEYCFLAIRDRILNRSVRNICINANIGVRKLCCRVKADLKQRVKENFKSLGILTELILGIKVLINFFYRHLLAHFYIRKSLNKRKLKESSLLFVSYYPAFEEEYAAKGIFKNKYYLTLQDKLAEKNIPVTWLLMYVSLYSYSYKEAIKMASNFIKNGERILVLEEFLNMGTFFKIIALYIRQVIKGIFLLYRIDQATLFADPMGIESGEIIKLLWKQSFCGAAGMQGIIYSAMFNQVLKENKNIKNCVYYCEMHAWEKALNASKEKENPLVRTIAFQHSTVSKNFFNYFYDEREIKYGEKPLQLPLPDVLAVNGRKMKDLFIEKKYSNVTLVESIRYLYLNELLLNNFSNNKRTKIVLVAGSINKKETISLLAMVKEAFPQADSFQIWFKEHPAMPFEPLFKEIGIDSIFSKYIIKKGNIYDFLKEATVCIVPSSTVSLEAIALGCEVIIPHFPDFIPMNPLEDFGRYYHKVTSPEELKTAIDNIFRGVKAGTISEYREFIRSYWNLDPALSQWISLLAE